MTSLRWRMMTLLMVGPGILIQEFSAAQRRLVGGRRVIAGTPLGTR